MTDISAPKPDVAHATTYDWASFFLLYAVVASVPVQALARVPGTPHTITKVAGGLLVLLWLGRIVLVSARNRRLVLPWTGVESGILFFGVAAVLSAFLSRNRALSMPLAITLAQYALVFYAVSHLLRHPAAAARSVPLFIGMCAISGALAAGAAMGRWVEPTVDTFVAGARIRRVAFGLQDANEAALYFNFALALLLFVPPFWYRRHWLFSAPALAGVAVGLVLTMSRTGWICAALLVIARGLSSGRRIRWALGLSVLLIVAAGSTVAYAPDWAENLVQRLSQGLTTGDTSMASRMAHYVSVSRTAWESGLFGQGLGLAEYTGTETSAPLGQVTKGIVHNVPLNIWLDTGHLGLAAYLWLWSCFIALLATAYRSAEDHCRQHVLAGAAILAVYALFSLVMPFMFRSSLPVAFGAVAGYCVRVMRSNPRAASSALDEESTAAE